MAEWTQEEENQLAKLWPDHKSTEIAKIMDRSDMSIRAKAKKLNLQRSDKFKKTMNQSWSDKQIKLLKDNFHTMPYKKLSELIGKTAGSIRTKAYDLGLTHARDTSRGAHMKTNKVSDYVEEKTDFKGTVSLYDIKDNQCHYVTDTGANMMLCGANNHEGQLYCTEHCHVVYTDFGKKRKLDVKPLGGF